MLLWVYIHTGQDDHGGNRTCDLWDTSPIPCQLSYEAKSVRVCGISELSQVPSIPNYDDTNTSVLKLYQCMMIPCQHIGNELYQHIGIELYQHIGIEGT